jgi:hypothetical protein
MAINPAWWPWRRLSAVDGPSPNDYRFKHKEDNAFGGGMRLSGTALHQGDIMQSIRNEIISFAADVFRDRLNRLGELESGAYAFYKNKLERGDHFTDRESALVHAIKNTYEPKTAFFEIGAGAGFFCIALAAEGFPAVAVEADVRRVCAAEDIRDALVAKYPALEPIYHVQKVRFGAESPSHERFAGHKRVAVCTNFVNGWTRNHYDLVVAELMKFDEFILDVAMFGEKRDSTRRHEVIDMFPQTISSLFLDSGIEMAGIYFRFISK